MQRYAVIATTDNAASARILIYPQKANRHKPAKTPKTIVRNCGIRPPCHVACNCVLLLSQSPGLIRLEFECAHPLYLLNEKGAPQQIETHPKKHLSNCCHTSSVPFRGRAKERTLFTKAVPLNGKSQRGRFEYELVWQVELYMTVWRFWISGISNRRSVPLACLFSEKIARNRDFKEHSRLSRIFCRFKLVEA